MVGGCFYRRELERACERVRAGSRSAESAFIDSRENLKDGRFRSLRDSSRRLLCSHLTGALVRPRRCALHLWGFWGSLPCALVAALPSFRSIHSWSSGLSTRMVCSLGALKLCELCTVRGTRFSILLCYRDILGIGYPTDHRLHLAFGRFTGTRRDNVRDCESRGSSRSFWLLSPLPGLVRY